MLLGQYKSLVLAYLQGRIAPFVGWESATTQFTLIYKRISFSTHLLPLCQLCSWSAFHLDSRSSCKKQRVLELLA